MRKFKRLIKIIAEHFMGMGIYQNESYIIAKAFVLGNGIDFKTEEALRKYGFFKDIDYEYNLVEYYFPPLSYGLINEHYDLFKPFIVDEGYYLDYCHYCGSDAPNYYIKVNFHGVVRTYYYYHECEYYG